MIQTKWHRLFSDPTTLWMTGILYLTVVIYQGYQYGQGDQVQILPCLFAQDHPGSFALDHYVQAYLQAGLNERTVFHFLFRFLGYQHPWIVFIWHVLLSLLLIFAWLKIAALGVKSQVFQYVSVALILIAGFHTNVGGNELYYNSVVPSLAAKATASWALYYWLREDFRRWILLLLLAVFLQPLVSLQLFILTSLSLVLWWLYKKKAKLLPWGWMGIYLAVTLPWIYLLAGNNGAVTSASGFMDIMEFRLSHHFFPSQYGWFHILLACIMVITCFFFYKERLKLFMAIIAIGCMVYTIGVEVYRLPQVLYTQWFKATIWMEALAFIMIAMGLEKLTFWPKQIFRYTVLLPVLLLLLVGAYRLSGWFGAKPEYMFPWNKHISEAVDVSLQAAARTEEDAVFIIPVDFTAFRWYGKRSMYVDYKSMLHQEKFLNEWYDRIGKIYAYTLKEKRAGFELDVFSKSLLDEPSLISTDFWTSLGITHIISENGQLKSLQKIYGNKSYSIYKLPTH